MKKSFYILYESRFTQVYSDFVTGSLESGVSLVPNSIIRAVHAALDVTRIRNHR